ERLQVRFGNGAQRGVTCCEERAERHRAARREQLSHAPWTVGQTSSLLRLQPNPVWSMVKHTRGPARAARACFERARRTDPILDTSDAQTKVQPVLKLSNKERYALQALFDLAFHEEG